MHFNPIRRLSTVVPLRANKRRGGVVSVNFELGFVENDESIMRQGFIFSVLAQEQEM